MLSTTRGLLAALTWARVDGEWAAFQKGSGERIAQTTRHRQVAGADWGRRADPTC